MSEDFVVGLLEKINLKLIFVLLGLGVLGLFIFSVLLYVIRISGGSG